MRIYAIGDIHGELKLLDALLSKIYDDLYVADQQATLVFLGDYVDRGPDSKGVIDLVNQMISNPGPFETVVALRGNHEDMMIKALAGEKDYNDAWIYNGGIQTLKSYSSEFDRSSIPYDHIKFLKATHLWYQVGNYVFVHANIDPSKPIDAQAEQVLLWDRSYNKNSVPNQFGYFVVHGHTPIQDPQVIGTQVNIDTGAVFGGHLTCLILDSTKNFHDFHGYLQVNHKDIE